MKHARFVIYSKHSEQLLQALGSDSIVIFDGHAGALTPRGRHNIAVEHAQRINRTNGLNKCYVGYIMYTGAGLSQSIPEQRKVFPTGVEYIALCEEAKPDTNPYLWR
jgi:uroporphyrinogen-III decarboxylase